MKRLLTLVAAALIVLGCIAVMDISAGTSDQSGEATQYDYSLDLGTAQDVDVLNQNAEQTDPSADALEWYTPVGRTLTIDSVDELREFAYVVNSGIDDFDGRTVSLAKGEYDISGSEWTPIGITVKGSDGVLIDNSFKGTFLGNGSIITGLTLTADDTPYYSGMDGDYYSYGFFGGVVGGHVSDLVFTDFTVDTPGTSANNNTVAVAVGALVLSGSVENITVGESGDEVIGHSRTAGVIGYVGGAKDASALGGDDNVLGEFVIRGCVNYANVSAQWNTSSHGTAAGILATINAKDSTADGCLIIISDNVNHGNICGYYSAGIVASDFCKSEKTVSGNINEGAITTLTPADGATEPASAAGIFLGQVSTAPSDVAAMTVEGNINNGTVTSSTGNASGIIGTTYNAEVYGNVNNGDVTGYKVASGIVKVMYGGVVGGNANYGTVSVTIAAVGADDPDVYAGGIVGYVADSSFPDRYLNAELVGTTYIESLNIVDGTVSGNTVYIGALAGCAVSGTVYGAEANHIGAIVVTGGTAKTLKLVDSHIDELHIKGGHNQSVIYTLDLDGSSIGALRGIHGAVHTGINLEIKGGEIGSFSLDLTGNNESYTTINLLITGADIGELKVSAGTSASPGYLNIAATDGGSVDLVDAECNVRLGTNVGNIPVANQNGIGIVLSPETITLNSNASGTVAPAWAVYDGEWSEEKFGSGSTASIGEYNAVSSEVFSDSISSPVSLRDGVSLFVMPGKTLTVSVEVTGTIVGMPGQSLLELQSDGLYGSLNAGTYVATEDGWESTVEVTFTGFPDGAVITVTDIAGVERTVSGKSISLAPGDYTAVGALDGYVFVPRKFTVGSSAASLVLEAVLEIPTLGYEVRFTADGATITLTATHPIDGVQFQYYAASGSVGTMLEANTMNVEEDGTYSFYVLASVGRYIAQSLTVDVEVDLPTKQVEVQVSFPESTGIPAQVFLADRATFLYPSDVEVEGYTVEGFLKDGQPYSGPLYDDPVVLTAVLSLDAPDLTYTSVLTFDGIRVTLSASHALDDAELACYRVTDGDPVPVEGGVFTTDVSGDYVFYAVASAGGMTSESERVTVTVSYVAPAVTVPVESAVGYAAGGSLALNASASDQVTLTYGSSDPSVASVDGSGVVTMVSAGKATVSVIGELPSGEKLDPVTVSIEVLTAPAVEGVTFNPVTDATHEIVEQVLPTVSEVPGSALEGGDVAVFDLTGTGERFTLSYADLGWSHITADNWERYDFYLVHIDEGYDIPSFTAGADGITVQPDGFSPYVFISAEKSAEPTPEPEPQPAAVTVSDTWIYAALAILLVECAAIMLLNRRRA